MLKIKNINVDELVGYSYDGYTYFSNGGAFKMKSDEIENKKYSYSVKCTDERIMLYSESINIVVDSNLNTLTFEKIVDEEFYYDKKQNKFMNHEKSVIFKRLYSASFRDSKRGRAIQSPLFKFVIELLKHDNIYEYISREMDNVSLDRFIHNTMKIYSNESSSVIHFLVENDLKHSLEEVLSDKELQLGTYDIQPSQKKSLSKVIKTLKRLDYNVSLQSIIPIVNSFNGNELAMLCKFIEVHNEIHVKLTHSAYTKEVKSSDLINILEKVCQINRYTRDFSKFLNYYMKLLFKQSWVDVDNTRVSLSKPLKLYLDFLRVYDSCEKANLFLDDYDLYPNDLKTGHDKLSERINEFHHATQYSIAENYANENNKFLCAVEKYSHLETFNENNFIVKIPNSMDELRREGYELNHCVAGYRSAIANGESKVVFLRESSDVDKPFVTIEVIKDEVRQIQGRSSKDIGKDALMFIESWASEKCLDLKRVEFLMREGE